MRDRETRRHRVDRVEREVGRGVKTAVTFKALGNFVTLEGDRSAHRPTDQYM